MTQSSRKFVGILLILALIVAWATAGTALYLLLPEGLPGPVLIVFFAIVGAGWFFPATWLIRWMSRPDSA